jgi:hypothetical protein
VLRASGSVKMQEQNTRKEIYYLRTSVPLVDRSDHLSRKDRSRLGPMLTQDVLAFIKAITTLEFFPALRELK